MFYLQCPYYWGPLSKAGAHEKLSNQPDGVFLLRDSSDEHHFFALSFRMYAKTHHVRISFSGGKNVAFNSLGENYLHCSQALRPL